MLVYSCGRDYFEGEEESEEEFEVFVGYKDKDNGYQGFIGKVSREEYELLRDLAEKCSRSNVLSWEKLYALSEAKDFLARAYIKIFEYMKNSMLSTKERRKAEKVAKAIGKALESFDIYRDDAPQLDFMLSFCIIDASESNPEDEYRTGKFWEIYEDEECFPERSLDERIKAGITKYILVEADISAPISEWIELDGRRQMTEQMISEGEIEWVAEGSSKIENTTVATEIEW